MVLQVYWPQDLLEPARIEASNAGYALVLGQRCEAEMIMVLNIFAADRDELASSGVLDSLSVISRTSDMGQVGIVGVLGKRIPTEKHWSQLIRFEVVDGVIRANDTMILVFEPPIPQMMQFYSLLAIPISLVDNKSYSVRDCQMADILLESLKDDEPQAKIADYSQTLERLNNCWNERELLLESHPKIPQAWHPLSTFNSLVLNISNGLSTDFIDYQKAFLKPLTAILLYLLLGVRHVFLMITKSLNTRIYNLPSLAEVSATAQQIDLRLQQFSYFPIQYIKTTKLALNGSKASRNLPRDQYSEYIRFYNTLWLIVNDITLGVSLGSLLLENEERITTFFRETVVNKLLLNDINDLSLWLMNSPGGVKLNNELATFLSDLFRWIIEFWRVSLVGPLVPYYRFIVLIIAISSSTFGATLGLSVFLDFLTAITFHIYCFYYSSGRLFNWLLNILQSLFYLFCGKKRNVLRKRTDSNNYELDQLLLGTLLFTVVMFLLPTVMAYYITFAIAELSIMVILGSLEISTALLNHFPLFVLLLRVKDPKRIPGGIELVYHKGYIKVSTVPIGLNDMFDHFNNVLNKLKNLYISKETVWKIIAGRPISIERTKLYKLLYSALPSSPISSSQLLSDIKNNFNL